MGGALRVRVARGERFFAEGAPGRCLELLGSKATRSGVLLNT